MMEFQNTSQQWTKESGRDIQVSGYPYKSVLSGLGIRAEELARGTMVLSIGEGFSNFAEQLQRESGAKVIAVDRLYSDPSLIKQPLREVSYKLEAKYGSSVLFAKPLVFALKDEQAKLPPISSTGKMAADIHNLPFSKDSFDRIYGHKVIQHINLAKTLPELSRLIKRDGEIRLGGSITQVMGGEKKLTSGMVRYIPELWEVHKDEIAGFDQAIQWAKEHGLSVYIILTEPIGNTPTYKFFGPSYLAGIIIFRKDNKWPEDIEISEDEIENSWPNKTKEKDRARILANLGRVFKIKRKSGDYYKLIPRPRKIS